MAAKNNDENSANGADKEKESNDKLGLGAILINEREKKGLSQEQVAEITRLRLHIIKDIENEMWDNLPPPVFVRGFIRSYARTLGVNENRMIELYEDTSPEASQSPQFSYSQSRPYKKVFISFILIILVIGLVLYFYYPSIYGINSGESNRAQDKKEEVRQKDESIEPKVEVVKEPSESLKQSNEPNIEEGEKKKQEQNKPSIAQTELVEIIEREKPPENTESLVSDVQELEEEPVETDAEEAESIETDPEEAESREVRQIENRPAVTVEIEEEIPQPDEEADETVSTTTKFVLTGEVLMRTWVRICVDGGEPKEYIFQPGTIPQWRASEGFFVVVGNAAGIKFDANGKKLENLGKLGQVKRFKFPEDYESTGCGE